MVKFQNLSATSQGAGFQYYDVQDFRFTKPGLFIAKNTGTYNNNSSTFSIPKNRPATGLTPNVMVSIMMDVVPDGTDSVGGSGNYHTMNGTYSDTVVVGSSGGFPVFYRYHIYVSSDENNIIFTINVGNPSGVNDVTSNDITISGRVFFYLAPF